MGDCMRRCKRIGGGEVIAVMEVSSLDSTKTTKRRKIEVPDEAVDKEGTVSSSSPTSVSAGGALDAHVSSSSCSHAFSDNQPLKQGLDLKVEASSAGTEISTFICSSNNNNGGFSRETTPTSELREEEMESSSSKKKRVPATKIPSAAEIEDFFSVAEKYEQKRFADKYNYDIVKDMPIEGGRYQWVRLKP